MVLAAKEEVSSRAAEAMEKLWRTYWLPFYSYVRGQGHSPEEAEDLTQEFFARPLAKDYLQHLRYREGKFRSFLLTFLKRFLSDEHDRAGAHSAPRSAAIGLVYPGDRVRLHPKA
jgi:RNA polymerase sigma-70 factor (ECF subfamily)